MLRAETVAPRSNSSSSCGPECRSSFEDEAELSIAARLGAEEGELSAGMEIDCELKTFCGEFSAHAALDPRMRGTPATIRR